MRGGLGNFGSVRFLMVVVVGEVIGEEGWVLRLGIKLGGCVGVRVVFVLWERGVFGDIV